MNTVDKYIASFPADSQLLLKEIRHSILQLAPDTEESISYGMPTYKLKGLSLVYYTAYKKHIGFYATPTGHTKFASELSVYKQDKGSVQFPLDKPLHL